MHDDDEKPANIYMSFNGFGRSPMLWGVPYMAGLGIVCVSFLPAMMLGTFVHGMGWLLALVALPLMLFVRMMCEQDDKALSILGKEVKWALIRKISGNTAYYGGALTIAPISYQRKKINVERGIKAAIRG